MNRFVEVVPLALTPLTPIHIGCGEDFEPTNYVIDGGVLYHFEPTRLALTQADRQRLIECAKKKADDAIRAVQRFFHERRAECRQASRLTVPVAAGVAEWYAERIGQVVQRESGGRTVSNQLEIERTAHHLHTGVPYLPGSSLKGSMRTGWLNALDEGPPVQRDPEQGPRERSAEVEAELLGGTFKSDPFRLVEVADASSCDVRSRIVFAVDRRKQPRRDRSGQLVEEKNLFVRREAICGGQLHALRGEIRFKSLPAAPQPPDVPPPGKRIGDFAALARACNRFYLQGLRAELEILRSLCTDRWIEEFESLIESLKPAFAEGRAMLLRVGRHSGAESVTLDRRRWIRIKSGKRSQDYHWAWAATTIWLAAEHESSIGAFRPFGWLLAQRAEDLPGADLERWCAAEAKTMSAVPKADPSPNPPALPSVTPGETVWDGARLQYNARNGTLAAIGPNNARANAFDDDGRKLLSCLPEEVQRKVRANQFVRVIAHVRGHDLIAVEVKP
jgi:CRISPR-associated protein Csm5